MSILAIDTVSIYGSMAIIDHKDCFVEYNANRSTHIESFFQILDTLFYKYNYNYDKLDYFAVVVGPGSFTGIRAGISATQGMSIVTGKPLYGVSTLEIQAYILSSLHMNNKKNIMAIIKHNKGFFTQLFSHNLLPLSEPSSIDDAGEIDCAGTITYRNCIKLPECDAKYAGLLVSYRLANGQKLDEAVPLYLNDPQYINKPVQ